MKYQALVALTFITLISNVISVSKNSCSTVKCTDSKPSSDNAVCYKKTSISSETGSGFNIQYQVCNSGYYCLSALVPTADSYTCSKEPTGYTTLGSITADVKVGLTPGSSCSANSNCYSNNCTTSKCKGKAEAESCTMAIECDVGLSCISSKCTKQRAAGEACSVDYDCVNDHGCNQSKCVKYYTLANGVEATSGAVCISATIRLKDLKLICDQYTLKTTDCGEGKDSCTYTRTFDNSEETGQCSCKAGSITQERECGNMNSSKKSTVANVHTNDRWGVTATVSYDDCIGKTLYGEEMWKIMNKSNYYYVASILLLFLTFVLLN